MTFPGKSQLLSEVAAGSIFGTFCWDAYTRFLRLAGEANSGVFPVLCLGPYPDDGRGAVPGPTIFHWNEDEDVVVEEHTSISAKTTERGASVDPTRQGRDPLGTIALGTDNESYMYCRLGSGSRAWVNLVSGVITSSPRIVAQYNYYVLVGCDELGEKRIIFDSLSGVEQFSSRRSA